jgi:cytoskeletal protein CcmA (bactofilin family)
VIFRLKAEGLEVLRWVAGRAATSGRWSLHAMNHHISTEGVLPKGLAITGDFAAAEDFTINGRFTGRMSLPDSHLSIEASALVKAKIVARTVTISGTVDGTIVASERVRLMPGASVTAHVATPSLVLMDGAWFCGTVDPKRTESAMQVARYREKNA